MQGNIGIGASTPAHPLHVVASASDRAIYAQNGAATGTQHALYGRVSSTLGRAVFGEALATSGEAIGVYGESKSTGGRGVFGLSTATSGIAYGGWFENNSSGGSAVIGYAGATAGPARAVWGFTNTNPDAYAGYFEGARNYFSGRVGIGVVAPAYQLHLSENSAAKPTSNTWTVFSDSRLKKNIRTIRGSLDQLLSLRGVTYQWIDPETQGNMAGTYTGLIAQEVEPVFPEWIREDARGYKTLTVIGFEGLVIEALRELRTQSEFIEITAAAQHTHTLTELESLRAENEELRDRIERLEHVVERLINK